MFEKWFSRLQHKSSNEICFSKGASIQTLARGNEVDDLHRSYQQVNEDVVHNLRQILENEPAKDLAAPLWHAANSYESKRQLFYQSLSQTSNPGIQVGQSERSGKSGEQFAQKAFRFSDPTEVYFTLTSRIAHLLQLTNDQCEEGAVLSSTSLQPLTKLIESSERVWNLGRLSVLRLASDVILKMGENLDLDHVEIVSHVKDQTPSLPIPAIMGVLKSGRTDYIFMEYVRGGTLDAVRSTLNEIQKDIVKSQLNKIFTTIRAIRPNRQGGHVLYGGGMPPHCKDMRHELRRASELIESEVEFNEFLLSSPESDTPGQNIRGLIRQYLWTDHDIVLTHADLHPRNIMAEEQSEPGSERFLSITGILDWELSGWYPSYWEYVKALHGEAPVVMLRTGGTTYQQKRFACGVPSMRSIS